MSGNQFSETELILLLVETNFLASGNHFLLFSLMFFKELVETHFSVQKKKYCFLFRLFFSASRNHYLNYREAYLKLLLLLLATAFFFIFQIFLSVGVVFPSSRNVFLNEFSIPASGNQFSVWLKQYSFI